MDFSEVLGQQITKSHLIKSIENGRVPHAQLFVGNTGSGLLALAIAYAKQLFCSKYEVGSDAYNLCAKKVSKLAHPDLHFVYPVNTTEAVKTKAISDNFSTEWRDFVTNNPYSTLYEWFTKLNIEKKQGIISVAEAEDMAKKLSMKAYEGGYKIMIVWMAETMNTQCANKILKLIEEPPQNTILLLLTEQEDQILTTIYSRCQKVRIPLLTEREVVSALLENNKIDEKNAIKVSKQAQGDYNKALQLLKEANDDSVFENLFTSWVRAAFKAKGNKASINDLLSWSDLLAAEGRETQKRFLDYCTEIFRQALLKNYKAGSLIYFESHDGKFDISKFAPFIHQNNIFEITKALEDANYHIERNGNAKIIFTDLSIQLTRLIHKRELV